MYTKEELKSKGFQNINAITKRFYLGLGNQMTLKAQGYPRPERLTYYQAKKSNLRIKPGSKSVPIYYQSIVPDRDFVDGELVEKDTTYKVIHNVFNIDQTEPILASHNQ